MSSRKKKEKKSSAKAVVKSEVNKQSTWSKEDTENLTHRMLKCLGKTDHLKYTSSLDRLPWDKVAFKQYSVEDCKQKWAVLSKEVRKFRTLTDLLQDVQEYLRDPYKGQIKKHHDYPKRPLTPYFQFFMEERPAFAAEHPQMTNLQVTAELSKKYRELPEPKKQHYVEVWKRESEIFQAALKKFKEEHPSYFNIERPKMQEPRTPALIFRDENIESYSRRHPNVDPKVCKTALRNEYKYLSDSQKQVYIERALKEQEEYVMSLDKYAENNPETAKKKTQKLILTKTERKLNDQYLGKPKKPPSNGYNLFCTEMMPTLGNVASQNRIIECARLWNLKSDSEKVCYQDRYVAMKTEYERSYAKYRQSLTPEQRKMEDEQNKIKKTTKPPSATSHVKVEKKEESSGGSSIGGSNIGDINIGGSSSDDSTDTDSDDEMVLDDSSDATDSDDSEDDEEDSDQEKEEKEKKEEENDPEAERFQRLAPARPTTPISALFLYQKAHRRKVEAQYPNHSADEITRLLARRYHELPEHKRHKYLQKEKEQRALYSEKMQQFIKEENMKNNGVVENQSVETPVQPQPVTGEQIYEEKTFPVIFKKCNNNKKAAEQQLRHTWSRMNKTKRAPFIAAAQKRNEENIAAYRDALIAVNGNDTMGSATSKNRRRLKFEGEPKKPPTNGYQLFSASRIGTLAHLSQNEKFKEIGRLWTSLAPDKKKTYQDEAKRETEKYKLALSSWLQQLPKDIAAQYVEQQGNSRKRRKAIVASQTAKKSKLETVPVEDDDNKDEEESSDSDADTDSSSSDDDDDESDSDDDSSSSSSSESSDDSDDSDDDSSDDDEDDDESSSSDSA